ncbi:hypothetical protein [Streptomyces sp. NPDC007088]|uniref:hypothetical protein n=1 Tax=Streptomyces sp. NPDC007088 TaxID=3364773 RepID=UPI00367FB8F9
MNGIGPGFVPPPPPRRRPRTAALVAERVALSLVSVCSIGFLTWATLLRLAFLTRQNADRLAFWLSVVGTLAGTTLVLVDPGGEEIEGWQGNLGMVFLLLNALGGTAYYLYADIMRRFPPLPAPAHAFPYARPQAPAPGQGPAQAQATTRVSGQSPAPAPPYGYPPAPHHGAHGPHPAPPAPPGRIDQVRAELDELSAYLRAREREREHETAEPGGTGFGDGTGPGPGTAPGTGTGPEYPGPHGWTAGPGRPSGGEGHPQR